MTARANLVRFLLSGAIARSVCGMGPSLGPNAAAEEPAARAKVSINASTFDFGTVPQGTKVVHDFILRNVG